MNSIEFIDYFGVSVFSSIGALSALRKRLDIIGFIFFSILTGVGGGTMRDLILGVPVFWIHDTTYILISSITAIAVYFTGQWIEPKWKLFLWLDAIGLSAFACIGAAKGLLVTGSPVLAIVTGVFTSTCGGILKDITAGEPSVLLRQEIYISAAALGSVAYVIASCMAVESSLASFIGFFAALFLRVGALCFCWSLPSWSSWKRKSY